MLDFIVCKLYTLLSELFSFSSVSSFSSCVQRHYLLILTQCLYLHHLKKYVFPCYIQYIYYLVLKGISLRNIEAILFKYQFPDVALVLSQTCSQNLTTLIIFNNIPYISVTRQTIFAYDIYKVYSNLCKAPHFR